MKTVAKNAVVAPVPARLRDPGAARRGGLVRPWGLRDLPWLTTLGALMTSCEAPPTTQTLPPAGVLRGTVLYAGQPPCTEQGRVVGAAVLLVFDQKVLPPPEGLALRSVAIKVIPGQTLFAEAAKSLPFAPTGERLCPRADAAPIVASAPWQLAPLAAGRYQVRAFYDVQGDFQPAFRISNAPGKGDVTGGVLANLPAALRDQPPVFADIPVGTPTGPGGSLQIPQDGVLVDNLTVALAKPSPFERPYFHLGETFPGAASKSDTTLPAAPREGLVMPADHRVAQGNPATVGRYLWRLRLRAGLPSGEVPAGVLSPYFFPIASPPPFPVFWFDANRDGKVEPDGDGVPGIPSLRALAPVVFLSKLEATLHAPQGAPRVLIPTITFPNEDITGPGASFSPTTPVFQDSLVAGVRPLAYCVANPSDPEGETLVVTPSPSDDDGAATLGDETQTKAAVARFLGRRAEAVRVLYACLPPGAYGVTGMHPTGQAWSLPNEAGYCMMGEAPSSGMCGQRPLLSSQGTVFSVGPARTAAACQERFGRLPPEDQERYRRGCLRGDEGERLAKGLLWN